MSGPFVDLPLTTGDFYTQTRQRQMNVNSKVAWERTSRANLPYEDWKSVPRTRSSDSPDDVDFSIEIDGSEIGDLTVNDGAGDVKIVDIDISGFSVGLHTLQLKARESAPGSYTFNGKVLRFVRHEYLNRLSVWVTLAQPFTGSGPYSQTFEAKNVAVIIHESVEEW